MKVKRLYAFLFWRGIADHPLGFRSAGNAAQEVLSPDGND
jgi:hypothetical protein